jgi:uncharacterized membrane protein
MPGPGDLEWFPETRISVLRIPAVRLLIPFLLVGAWYTACFLFLPLEKTLILGGLLIAYMIPPSGKESIIPLGIVLGIHWGVMAASVVVLDVVTGLFMILNLDVAFRIPYLGPWIARFLAWGKDFMAERPWLARWRVPGLAFFVMLPFQGTGGTGSPLVGWMMGLRPSEILLAISIGATVESLFFALGSELVLRLILSHGALGLVAALMIFLLVLLARHLFRQKKGG